MKTCKCGSTRILQVTAKCSDLCSVQYGGFKHVGYVPSGIGIGDDMDYIEIDVCLNCGQLQSKFPVSDSKVVKALRSTYGARRGL